MASPVNAREYNSPLSIPLGDRLAWRGQWGRLALLLVIVGVAWCIVGATHDIWGPDETRYAQVAKELLTSDNWLLLKLQGQPYSEKPPLPFWMLAAMLKLGGGTISPLLLRLPAIVLGLMALGLTYDIGLRRFGRDAAWLAALVLVTMPVFGDEGPQVRLDMPLTAWTTLALWAWLTRPQEERMGALRLIFFWLGIICGFLTKGPLVLLFVLSAVLSECWMQRGTSRVWQPLRACGLLWGLLAFFGALAAWMIGQVRGAGLQFVIDQIKRQTVQRFLEGDHAEPFYYYPKVIFSSTFMPWTIALIPLGVFLWRRRGAWPRSIVPIFAWIVVPFIFLSIAHGKRQAYLMPLAPGAAVLIGWYLDKLMREGVRLPWLARLTSGAALIAGFAGGCFLVLSFVVFSFVYLSSYFVLGVCVIALFIIGFRALGRRSDLRSMLYAVAALGVVGLAIDGFGVEPEMNWRRSPKQFSEKVQALLDERHEQRVSGIEDAGAPEFQVYGNYNIVEFDRGEVRKGLIAEMAPVVMGMEKDAASSSETLSRAGYRPSFSDKVAGRALVVYERDANASTSKSQTLN